MRSSQVYQPTTTSLPHQRNKQWLPSISFLVERNSRIKRLMWFIFGVVFSILGIAMIIVGLCIYKNVGQGDSSQWSPAYHVSLCIIGLLSIGAAVFSFVTFYKIYVDGDIFCYYMCCPDKMNRIRKSFQDRGRKNGQGGEPISAQYYPPAPPSVDSSPPPFADISEQQMLMGDKSNGGDDSERILEEDPRIVLTPLKSHEEV